MSDLTNVKSKQSNAYKGVMKFLHKRGLENELIAGHLIKKYITESLKEEHVSTIKSCETIHNNWGRFLNWYYKQMKS